MYSELIKNANQNYVIGITLDSMVLSSSMMHIMKEWKHCTEVGRSLTPKTKMFKNQQIFKLLINWNLNLNIMWACS